MSRAPVVLRVGGVLSMPVRIRGLVVGGILLLGLLVVVVLTLTLGRLGLSPDDLLRAAVGGPDALGARERIVLETLRGPRLVVALGAGAAFGVSGALFQTVTRNPLGSPDVIGLSAGAAAGAAAFGLLWTGILPLPLGALVGALVAIAVVYLGTGRGFSSPVRMIVIGIGVSAMSLAFVQFVIARVGLEQATVLASYLNGSLASRSWQDAAIVGVCLLVLVPCALVLSPRLGLLEMGDETADALGARSSLTRACSVLVAVGLATAAVSVAGPIAFIALTAPQIAKRLTRAPGAGILVSAIAGALLLAVADLLVQQSPFPVQLPVGILTAALGGIYLGYLLLAEWRKGTV
ncbi:FecCD family ABC transporter permease [Compostimonas suwonensis]|uniref:Iron complex transport system permease protein n=1 Tax=Compostimonas suwonensis TaxID=1048394 RepID=A0A2M9BUP6_9MICO|nr:iron chelate uptake ABC transporter family permease subunit [Compostimonas suwonensis]PJJ61622.1 iron complex transport system permease protein [Compostimonas suwonensis]